MRLPLDLKRLRQGPRWLCFACDAEGQGPHPEACPQCGDEDAWYESDMDNHDPRPMADQLRDLLELVADIRQRDGLH